MTRAERCSDFPTFAERHRGARAGAHRAQRGDLLRNAARNERAPNSATAFERAPGIVFHREGIVTPREVEGTDDVHVARLRAPNDAGRTEFAMWCVGDQLRKGAATNAVQILELLLEKGYVGA